MRTLVVKFGGHAMSDEHGHFAHAIGQAISEGNKVAVVHGGGPQINSALEAAGITSSFLGGFRVTTPEVFDVVERVLAKEVGPAVASSLSENGIPAEAISGRSNILFAERQTTLVDGSSADLGLVGTIKRASAEAISQIFANNVVPVISPIASEIGTTSGLNVNADIAAAAITGALGADELIVMTDVPGIYRNWPDRESLISKITVAELEAIKSSFAEGMAPKVQACLEAVKAGAQSVRIIDGRDSESFSKALKGIGGTVVTA